MVRNLKTYSNDIDYNKTKLQRTQIARCVGNVITTVFLAASLFHFVNGYVDVPTIGYSFDESCGIVDAQRHEDNYTITYFDGDTYEYSFDELSSVEPESEFLSNYKTRKIKVSDEHTLVYHDVGDKEVTKNHTLAFLGFGGAAVFSRILTKQIGRK